MPFRLKCVYVISNDIEERRESQYQNIQRHCFAINIPPSDMLSIVQLVLESKRTFHKPKQKNGHVKKKKAIMKLSFLSMGTADRRGKCSGILTI